jgi:hypothetical protein
MSGLEVLGIIGGVLQIADVGARLSVKLLGFSHKVKDADINVKHISTEVALTCAVLRDLSENLKKDEATRLCNENAVKTAEKVVHECKTIFEELAAALDGKMSDEEMRKSGKGIIGRVGREVRFAFIQPQMELMRTHLEKLKSTLHLMLEVLNYARQLRRYVMLPCFPCLLHLRHFLAFMVKENALLTFRIVKNNLRSLKNRGLLFRVCVRRK